MNQSIYVTGTDTGVGKTVASCVLLRALQAHGTKAVGMKPVASGCRTTAHGLRNEDAEALIAASAFAIDYDDVNPYTFADPIAPHLAAADTATTIGIARIETAYRRLMQASDFVVVEGVGGWAAPLGTALMQADLARALNLPVVLVVGLRLGCINHALLSARAIEADGCRLIGWIANRIDPSMLRAQDNLATLRERLRAPLLGVIEYAADGGQTSNAGTEKIAIDLLR